MLRISQCDVKGNTKRGVYFYGEQVFTSDNTEDYGVRSYQFFLSLVDDENKEVENISFIDTLNLKGLPRKVHKLRKELSERGTPSSTVDWESYLQTSHKELYDYHIERANRKLAGVIPSIKEIVVPWLSDNKLEFLEFTDNYHFEFELEGKYGAATSITENDIGELDYPFSISPLDSGWSYYDLPLKYRDESKGKRTIDFYNSLPIDVQLQLAKGLLKRIENPEECLPYVLCLNGVDDFSYSKYFCTLKEAEQEMNYLRIMQPLDFKLDILDRGYLFTN